MVSIIVTLLDIYAFWHGNPKTREVLRHLVFRYTDTLCVKCGCPLNSQQICDECKEDE